MIQLAKDFAAELKEVCNKYSAKLSPGYSFHITTQEFEEGVKFYNLNRLLLCDNYFPENGYSPLSILE